MSKEILMNTAKFSVYCVIFILLYLEYMFQNRKVCELDESILENVTLTFCMSQKL